MRRLRLTGDASVRRSGRGDGRSTCNPALPPPPPPPPPAPVEVWEMLAAAGQAGEGSGVGADNA